MDDRSYKCLPYPECPMLEEALYRQCMVRFNFLLTALLNLADQAAHEVCDLGTFWEKSL